LTLPVSHSWFVAENINLAFRKPGYLSSVDHDSTSYLALDGRRKPNKWVTDYTKHTCSRTLEEAAPYFHVDLGSVHIIREVVIYNQKLCELECFADLFELVWFPLLFFHFLSSWKGNERISGLDIGLVEPLYKSKQAWWMNTHTEPSVICSDTCRYTILRCLERI